MEMKKVVVTYRHTINKTKAYSIPLKRYATEKKCKSAYFGTARKTKIAINSNK